MEQTSRILLLNKEPGQTSFTSLNHVKRVYGKKVGHAGTLDKFAQGLLIVLTGAFTKLNPIFSNMDKTYRAHIAFGSETDTLDPEGEVIGAGELPSFETIKEAMNAFSGDIMQEPPIYSALHVGGKRASTLARKGKDVQLQKRPVRIDHFTPISYEHGVLIADVAVSKGTYIRSLARDLGLACESRAHLIALVRTSIGPFSLEEAEEIEDRHNRSDEYLRRLDCVEVAEIENSLLFSVANGRYPDKYSTIKEGSEYIAFYSSDHILRAVGNKETQRLIAQINRGGV